MASSDDTDTTVNAGGTDNTMNGVNAGRDATQNVEYNQQVQVGGEFEVVDPKGENSRIDLCEAISNLPFPVEKIVLAMLGLGGSGIAGTIGWIYLEGTTSISTGQFQTGFMILLASVFILAIPVTYKHTDNISECPECGERWAFRTMETRQTGRTPVSNGDDTIHGKREKKCRSCGHSDMFTEPWSSSMFAQ